MKVVVFCLLIMCVGSKSFSDKLIVCKIQPTGTVIQYDITISTNKMVVAYVVLGEKKKEKERNITLDEYKKLSKLSKEAISVADRRATEVTDSWVLHIKTGNKYIPLGVIDFAEETPKKVQRFMDAIIRFSPLKMEFKGFA